MSVPNNDRLKERVVAFRIPTTKGNKLDDRAGEMQVVNVSSGNKLARKVVLDFLDGKLVYLNAQDKSSDPALTLGFRSS